MVEQPILYLKEQREEIVRIGKQMVADGVAHNGQGNISFYDREKGMIAITPSAIPYDERTAADICVVDLDRNVIEGIWKPTSEIALHMAIYQSRPDVNAIVHTHPPYASVFAVIGEKEIPMVLIEAALGLGGALPVAPYARPGTEEVARLTAQALGDASGAILAHHGLVTVGTSLERAYAATLAAEGTARTVILAKAMGISPQVLDKAEVEALRDIYLNQYKASRLDA